MVPVSMPVWKYDSENKTSNRGHIFEEAFTSTQTSDLSSKLGQGLRVLFGRT